MHVCSIVLAIDLFVIHPHSAGRTTSSLTFTVTSFTLPLYTCTTNFSAPLGLPVTATNTPALSFNWTSPQLVVKGAWMLIRSNAR